MEYVSVNEIEGTLNKSRATIGDKLRLKVPEMVEKVVKLDDPDIIARVIQDEIRKSMQELCKEKSLEVASSQDGDKLEKFFWQAFAEAWDD